MEKKITETKKELRAWADPIVATAKKALAMHDDDYITLQELDYRIDDIVNIGNFFQFAKLTLQDKHDRLSAKIENLQIEKSGLDKQSLDFQFVEEKVKNLQEEINLFLPALKELEEKIEEMDLPSSPIAMTYAYAGGVSNFSSEKMEKINALIAAIRLRIRDHQELMVDIVRGKDCSNQGVYKQLKNALTELFEILAGHRVKVKAVDMIKLITACVNYGGKLDKTQNLSVKYRIANNATILRKCCVICIDRMIARQTGNEVVLKAGKTESLNKDASGLISDRLSAAGNPAAETITPIV